MNFTKLNYHYQNVNYESDFIFDFWSCSSQGKPEDGSKFSGAYPNGFLKRWRQGFADSFENTTPVDILHVCGGRVPKHEGMTQDISERFNPDYQGNAETFCDDFDLENKFQWCISDSPYNKEAAKKYYDCELLNKSKMLQQMIKAAKPGGFVGVLDQTTQAGYPKSLCKRIALIGLTSIPNLDARIFTVYQKNE